MSNLLITETRYLSQQPIHQ